MGLHYHIMTKVNMVISMNGMETLEVVLSRLIELRAGIGQGHRVMKVLTSVTDAVRQVILLGIVQRCATTVEGLDIMLETVRQHGNKADLFHNPPKGMKVMPEMNGKLIMIHETAEMVMQ